MNNHSHDTESDHGQALPAGTWLEEFVIERVLGSGGFGITYLARDTALGRQVVIKENLPVQFCFRDPSSLTVSPRHSSGDDAENFQWSLENFSKEAAMLASLDHPGIVRVHRSFQAFGTAYFVMPFVEGMALDELAKQREGKPFSEEELRGLVERVLGALDYLHERGIYHRDIKPGNLLITNEGIPVLIDFGSARQQLSERSMTVVESPGYTPFEQLQTRGNIGPWSDLYALGATLVKLMTGEAPPKTNDRSFGDPWRPLIDRVDLAGKFSVGFLKGIDRSLKLQIEDRWQEAGEWLATLRGEVAPEMMPPSGSESPLVSTEIPGKKKNHLPWIIAASVVLGLFALAKISNDKKAAIVRVKDAEEHAARAELEQQALVAQAKAKEEADAKDKSEKLSLPGSKAGEQRDFEIAPGVKITMCWIPPGVFLMGSPKAEVGRDEDETQHRVKSSKGFWLAKTETTQAQWQAVMNYNPSEFKADNLPVDNVSWDDINGREIESIFDKDRIVATDGFLYKVNEKSEAGVRFNLPTEAQWEYACRAGATGSCLDDLDQLAWYKENSELKTHPVGEKKANDWGLHDMQGNVLEWCSGVYADYPSGAVVDPYSFSPGWGYSKLQLVRGGAYGSTANSCRVAQRGKTDRSRNYGFGFRLTRDSAP